MSDAPMCIWEHCDQEAVYCPDHAREFADPLGRVADYERLQRALDATCSPESLADLIRQRTALRELATNEERIAALEQMYLSAVRGRKAFREVFRKARKERDAALQLAEDERGWAKKRDQDYADACDALAKARAEAETLREDADAMRKLLHDWRESFKDSDCFREDSDAQILMQDTNVAIDAARQRKDMT